MSQQNSATKATTTVLLSAVFVLTAFCLRYLLTVYLTNRLTPEFYGDFSIALRILSLVATVSLLGTSTSLHRYFSRYYREGQQQQAIDYLDWNLRFIMPPFLVSAGFGLVLFVVMLVLHVAGINALDNYHLAVYMFWIAPLAAICILLLSVLVGIGKTRLSTFMRNILRGLLFLVFFLVGIEVFDLARSTLFVVLAIFLVYLVILATQLFSLSNFIKPVFQGLTKKADNNVSASWRKLSLRLAYSNVIYLIVCSLDLLIVETIHPHEASVGYYAAVMVLTSLLPGIAATAYLTLRPDVSHLLDTDREQLRARLMRNNLICILLLLALSSILVVFGKPILAVFGSAYVHVYPVLLMSTLGILVICLTTPSTMLLAYSGNEKILMKVNTLELILLVVSGVVLTYFFSIMGMAVATLIAGGIKSTLFTIQCYQKTGIKALTII